MQTVKYWCRSFLWVISIITAHIYPYGLSRRWRRLRNFLYTAWVSQEITKVGKFSSIAFPAEIQGGEFIRIGEKSTIGRRAVITAWKYYNGETYSPTISIGDNVSIGDDSHLTSINSIEIGDNVLMGKKITITDNSHGKSTADMLILPPLSRTLYSAGPVKIEDGVWIGDKVSILPNVRIGKNSIVGANAVVTKDIPSNCVAGGIPARVLKHIV